MKGPLYDFCSLMVDQYGSPEIINADDLAEEFATHFFVSTRPTLIEFHLLGKRFGVDMAAAKLPPEFRAHHYLDRSSERYSLEYRHEQWVGTSEFNIAHDLFEIIQETFEEVRPGYRAPRDPARPTCMAPHANRFAAALVMNRVMFSKALIELGLDMVAPESPVWKSICLGGPTNYEID